MESKTRFGLPRSLTNAIVVKVGCISEVKVGCISEAPYTNSKLMEVLKFNELSRFKVS